MILFSIFILFWFIWSLLRTDTDFPRLMVVVLLAYIALLFIKVLSKQNKKDKRENYLTWGKGADAELFMDQELEKLPSEYKVINDFNTGRGNIDHIVVGPTGIFTIETKSSKGLVQYQNNQLIVNRNPPPHDYLKQTNAEAVTLSKLIQSRFTNYYPVTGILEFPFGQIDTGSIHGMIDHIWIGGRNFHNYVLKKLSCRLTDKEITDIHQYLVSLNSQKSDATINL